MSKESILITTASWEPRFKLGFERLIEDKSFKSIIMYYFKEYADVSKGSRDTVKKLCSERSISINEIELKQKAEAWKKIFTTITEVSPENPNVTLDISTMPRETIWTILYLLKGYHREIHYVYHKPNKYSTEWLSRDPDKPRLVYKLSGIAKLGLPTVLVILTGFDIDRVKQLIYFFEPEETLLGIQIGTQFNNQILNAEKHIAEFKNMPGVKIFNIDAYSEDHGLNGIEESIHSYIAEANLITSSLGPKLTAISLFQIHSKYNDSIALAYAPSREFNIGYSDGIGETIEGSIQL